jgi:proteasome lid subunit RPN8/RPN11
VSRRLQISSALRDEMLAHLRAGLPNEACGILGGGEPGVVTSVHPTRNADASPYRYTVHPDDLLRVQLELDAADKDIVGIFHSHPSSAAYPSRTDVELAALWPQTAFVIVSLRSQPGEVAAFDLTGQKIEELVLEVV